MVDVTRAAGLIAGLLLLSGCTGGAREAHSAATPRAVNASNGTPAPTPSIQAASTVARSAAGDFDARKGPDTVSGRAVLTRTAEGSLTLSLSNFVASPGPNLWVYLSRTANPGSEAEVRDGVELGRLQVPRGDQSYPVQEATDLGAFKSAVVFCRTYHVIFGIANLA